MSSALLPFRVMWYMVPGGRSVAVTSRFTKPSFSRSSSRFASVRLLFTVRASPPNLLGDSVSCSSTSLAPFFDRVFNRSFNPSHLGILFYTWGRCVNFIYILSKKEYLVYKSKLSENMERLNKYPQLIVHYQKKGYRVKIDSDLTDVHGWIPRELYVALVTKATKLFGQERGKLSKALAEAVKGWVENG